MKASEDGSLSWAVGVPAPVDADGEVVPLTTKVVYDKDGAKLTVLSFDFKSDGHNNGWTVFCALGPNFMAQPYGSQELHIHRPDSWERLEEDAGKTSCGYFGRSGLCVGCPALAISKMCNAAKSEDIVRRAKALSGLH